MSSPTVPIVIAILVIVLAVVFIAKLKQGKGKSLRKTNPEDHQALFVIGIAFIPIGIGTGNNVFIILGIVFMIIGIAHKDEWDKKKKVGKKRKK